MCDIVNDYFVDIFTRETDISAMNSGDIPRVINNLDNEEFTANLEFVEFKKAVYEMRPDKTPDPDDLNSTFFQHF